MKLLTVDEAYKLTPNTIYRLGYDAYNMGVFEWKHEATMFTINADDSRGVRLKGSCRYEGTTEWLGPDDYLYEHGPICRGSGAEPCWILEEHETYSDIVPFSGCKND